MPLSPAAIERQLVAFIDAHMEVYQRAQEAQEGDSEPTRGEVFPLPLPATIVPYNSEQRFAEQDLPAVVVQLPQELRGRRGMSRASWDADVPLQVGVLAAASDASYARANAGTYLAALRWMFTTIQDVDGLAQGVDYISDGLSEPFSVGQSRFMAAGELTLNLFIRGVADRVNPPGATDPVPADNGIDLTLTASQP